MRVLAFIALCCVAALSVPVAAQTAPAVPVPPDPRVLIVGDSVSLGAQGSIAQKLGIRGWHVTQMSRESMHVWQASEIVDAFKRVGAVGQVVIVQLGTNDGFDANELTKWIDGVMPHLADVPRVYWVNLRQFASWVPAANAVIAATATRYPNVRIIDWDTIATPHPEIVYGDGYHLNPAGQSVMADLFGYTLDAFLLETAATTTTAPPTTVPTTATGGTDVSSKSVERKAESEGVELTTVAAIAAGGLVLVGLGALLVSRLGARKRSPLA